MNAKDNEGQTPLYVFARGSNLKIIQELIKNGADVNARTNDGRTPLSRAYDDKIISFLTENGATE